MKFERRLNERCSNKIPHVRYKPQDWHVHRSQPRENINAGDTTMVWRNNNLTGTKDWTGPGVVVAVSPTRTSFWISMRGCLLKCLSEQVRKATDAERLGAELSKNSGNGTVEKSPEKRTTGPPTEEPPADTRPIRESDSGSCRSSTKCASANS